MKTMILTITLCTLQTTIFLSQVSPNQPTPNDKVKALIIKKTKDSDDLSTNACYNPGTNTISVKSLALFSNHPIVSNLNSINSLLIASRLLIFKGDDLIWTETQDSPNIHSILKTTQIPCEECELQLLSLENNHIFNLSNVFSLPPHCDDLNNNHQLILELWILGYNSERPGPTLPISVSSGCSNILPSECIIPGTHFISELLSLDCYFCE